MPRDSWKSTHQRAALKRALVAQAEEERKRRKRLSRKRNSKKPKQQPPKTLGIHGNWNPNSKLWFGRFKDQAIKDIPTDYLQWLTSQPSANRNFQRLCGYLKDHIKTRRLQPTSELIPAGNSGSAFQAHTQKSGESSGPGYARGETNEVPPPGGEYGKSSLPTPDAEGPPRIR